LEIPLCWAKDDEQKIRVMMIERRILMTSILCFFIKEISLTLYTIYMKIVKVLIPVHFLDTKIENSLTVLNK
jgi:hypothetical protein